MLKGKILKFSDSYAIVCSDTLAYQKIKLKAQMEIGQSIYYFEEDIIAAPVAESTSFFSKLSHLSFSYRVAPLLAVLLIAVMVFNHQQISPTSLPSYGVVSIDINPSLSLLVNDQGIVDHAEGKNEDGVKLLERVNLNDKPLEKAIEEIIVASERQGYLDANKQIFIATTEQSEDHIVTTIVEQLLEDSSVDDPYTVYVAQVDYSLYDSAEEDNVSIGHYYMDITTDATDDTLFNIETIEKIIQDDDAPIQKHQTKESITEKQEEKRLQQEEKKETITEKQEVKHEQQEEHKESIKEKQEEKRQEQDLKKEEKETKKEEKEDHKPSNNVNNKSSTNSKSSKTSNDKEKSNNSGKKE